MWIIFTRKHNNILLTVSLEVFWKVILFNVPNLYLDALSDIGHYLGALYNMYSNDGCIFISKPVILQIVKCDYWSRSSLVQYFKWYFWLIFVLELVIRLLHHISITVMSLEAPCAKTSWRTLLFHAILGITGALIVCFDIWWFKQVNNSETGFGGHHCDFEQHLPCLTVHVCMNSISSYKGGGGGGALLLALAVLYGREFDMIRLVQFMPCYCVQYSMHISGGDISSNSWIPMF